MPAEGHQLLQWTSLLYLCSILAVIYRHWTPAQVEISIFFHRKSLTLWAWQTSFPFTSSFLWNSLLAIKLKPSARASLPANLAASAASPCGELWVMGVNEPDWLLLGVRDQLFLEERQWGRLRSRKVNCGWLQWLLETPRNLQHGEGLWSFLPKYPFSRHAHWQLPNSEQEPKVLHYLFLKYTRHVPKSMLGSFPRYPDGSLPHFLQIFAHFLLSSWWFLFDHYTRNWKMAPPIAFLYLF